MKYKVVRQFDERDCGAACLAMICKYYGLKISLSGARELTKTDLNGTNIYGLIKAAEEIGFNATPLFGDCSELINGLDNNEIRFPFIAHIILNNQFEHFVVIYNIKNDRVIVADPAVGIVKYRIKDFTNVWTGKIVTFQSNGKLKGHKVFKNNEKQLCNTIKKQISLILITLICSIVISATGIISAYIFQYIVNLTQTDLILYENDSYSILYVLCGAVISLYFVELILNIVRGKLLSHLSNKLDESFMLQYYKKIIDLPMNFFGTRKSGEILSRFSNATEIRTAITDVLFSGTINIIMVLAGGFFLFQISLKLFIIIVLIAVLFIIISIFFKNKFEFYKREFMENDSQVTTILKESIDGIETIKIYNYAKIIKQKVEVQFYKLLKSIYCCNILENNRSAIVSAISSIGIVLIIAISVIEITLGNLTIGELFSFYVLCGYFLSPFVDLVGMQKEIQSAFVAFQRLGDLMNLESENFDNGELMNNFTSDIIINDVSFNYGYREPVIKNLSLKIKGGQTVGIVGKSGCGKSTLAKLLLGLYDVNSGEIRIGNKNLRNFNKNSVRDKISYLPQVPFFFADTIINNLRMSNNDITKENIIEMCQKVGIHDYIMTLPFNYDTVLEENGNCLSGGQKQLLGIVRAFISKPDILILDEPTSNLDSITESNLEELISKLSSESLTCIIISHRMRTVVNCDNIFLIDDGKVVESGTHNELLLKKGRYYKFWSRQNSLNIN
ncbi:MAG: peptidase domain-containing ABC transporter [Ruminococcus sp.]|nr:peptidase domain-containing ABC transporter [Ruminococcus sp.]